MEIGGRERRWRSRAIAIWRFINVPSRWWFLYIAWSEFPAHERFDLCDQMRRASKSVVANIVEGYSHKDTPGKAKQFWRNAMGSANEMVEHLETAVALGYASQDTCRPYVEEYVVTAKRLNKLIQSWRKL